MANRIGDTTLNLHFIESAILFCGGTETEGVPDLDKRQIVELVQKAFLMGKAAAYKKQQKQSQEGLQNMKEAMALISL